MTESLGETHRKKNSSRIERDCEGGREERRKRDSKRPERCPVGRYNGCHHGNMYEPIAMLGNLGQVKEPLRACVLPYNVRLLLFTLQGSARK